MSGSTDVAAAVGGQSQFWHQLPARLGGATGCAGGVIVMVVLICGIFAPLIAPYSPVGIDLSHKLVAPDAQFWCGTDQAGRDVLSRIIWGGGWLEQAVMRSLDAMAAIPLLIWAIAIVGIVGVDAVHIGPLTLSNDIKVMTLLGVLYIPGLARLTYTSALGEAAADYVVARRLQGVAGWRIMLSDVLPNCLSPVIVQATLLVAVGIIIESALSFVGLGVQPPTPSWGTMLSEARNFLFTGEWWLSLFPGLAISFTVIGFNLLGDGLRDVLDPRRNVTILPT